MASPEVDLAVVGAGPGGYAAAFLAADLGLSVALVDPEPAPGGVCLHRGCIPSKALLHVAKLLADARDAADLGLRFGEPEIDVDRVREWTRGVVEGLTGGLGRLAKARRVTWVRARAAFEDAHRLRLHPVNGGGEGTLACAHAIVATGSVPTKLPGLPEDSERVLDSTSALALREVPKRLLVVGGGYIGLELGSVYAALGSRVTLVEMTGSLLPGVDPDLVRPLAKRMESQLAEIHLETKLAGARETKTGLSVNLEGPDAGKGDARFDAVLVAVGRRPVTDELGLETTKVEVGEDGFVRVDEARRTAEPTVFAIGDVAGQPLLAHKATHEGRVAAEAVAGRAVAYEPRAVPAVVFTDPEVAWCGLTEAEAREAKRDVEVARFPWSASGRAATLHRSDGVTKLVLDPDSERVLGVGICGPGAGELLAEGVLAVEMGATARDLALSIHAHPTLSETLMEAAELFLGHPTHVAPPRRKQRSDD